MAKVKPASVTYIAVPDASIHPLVSPSEKRTALLIGINDGGTARVGPNPVVSGMDPIALISSNSFIMLRIEDWGAIVQSGWSYRSASPVIITVIEAFEL